ncbi:hypothetical protein LBMAG57_19490 [Verrucomicrobiota bacterium]|nr:hypothetical protein LBMAG57_19490 [Verrucomicrobiota bacterium]
MSKHADTFFRREPIYRAMADMPALTHWRDRTVPWTPEQSDVIAWVIERFPELSMEEARKICSSTKGKGVVEFTAGKLWRGTEDTRRLDQICERVDRQRRKKTRTPKQRAAKPAQRSTAPALPPVPHVRTNDRMAAALVVFHRWKAASKIPAWTFADLVRSFVIHSGGGKPDTMRRYIRALHAAGWLHKDADGMLSASPTAPPTP